MRKITKVILHCSDSPDTMDIGAKEISLWHKQRGFKAIGYHHVLRRNGAIEEGRFEDDIGAHCKGHNSDSIGICLVGRKEFTKEQMDALFGLYLEIKTRHNIDHTEWFGHYEFDSGKTCPNLDMNELRQRLASL